MKEKVRQSKTSTWNFETTNYMCKMVTKDKEEKTKWMNIWVDNAKPPETKNSYTYKCIQLYTYNV